MTAQELRELLGAGEPVCILDVRSSLEFRGGHIPGALHAPGWKILFGLAPLPRDRSARAVVTCEHGPRAQMARAILATRGYANVALLDGHMARWRRDGHPIEQ
jgi:hydroxyacylglutathione hydrolase